METLGPDCRGQFIMEKVEADEQGASAKGSFRCRREDCFVGELPQVTGNVESDGDVDKAKKAALAKVDRRVARQYVDECADLAGRGLKDQPIPSKMLLEFLRRPSV